MSRSERRQLTTELTASYGKLGRFLADEAVTDCMLEDCDPREAEWCILCLNLGHVAQLAQSVAARVDRLPESEALLDMAEFAARHCCEDAGEAIAGIREHQPPERCFTCGAVAHWRYYENPYMHISPAHGGAIVVPPYFCDQCAPHDAELVGLRNSPRVAVGCYDNTHDEPEVGLPPSSSATGPTSATANGSQVLLRTY